MRKILGIAAAAIAVAMFAAVLIVTVVSLAGANSRLQQQVTNLSQQLSSQGGTITGLQSDVAGLQAKMAGLTVPTDPLSAYNSVCHEPVTNDSTGVTQTYWFPCTNSAQTIPQPGT